MACVRTKAIVQQTSVGCAIDRKIQTWIKAIDLTEANA